MPPPDDREPLGVYEIDPDLTDEEADALADEIAQAMADKFNEGKSKD